MAASDTSRNASNPSSTLLKDMLREKKAQTQRVNKTYDMDGSEDRGVQSSPIPSIRTSGRQSSQPRHGGGGGGTRNVSVPKEMNMKEMEQHLSKINKQNFDLKLEVFHRRQRIEVLEAKVVEMDKVTNDNAEMQSINEDLLLELEKRDVAVQEAVGLICELEAKVEAMEANIEEMGAAELYFGQSQRRSTVLASPLTLFGPQDSSTGPQADLGNSVSRQDRQDKIGTEASHSRAGASPDKADSSQRIPSFLREDKKSTHVLRSLYSSESLFSENEDEDDVDEHIISSPRLSILSESGFSEIYGGPKDVDRANTRQADERNIRDNSPARAASPPDVHRQARLRKWVEERDGPTTPTRTSTKPPVNDHFSSIGEILEKEPSGVKGHQTTDQLAHEQNSRQGRNVDKAGRKKIREHQRRPSSPAFVGPMFGGAMLPPTPGTMSSATIAGNSSTPSIITEKSLVDGKPFFAGSYSASIPDGRPYSSDSNYVLFPTKALTFDGESDIEPESPPSTRSHEATRVSGAEKPIRPSLTTSATATVFSGEGYATTRHSRTLSYPSPTGRPRRLSEQLSPSSEKSFPTVGDRASSLAHQDRRSGSSANTTPTKRGARELQARSSPAKRDPTMPDVANLDAPLELDVKPGRSASLRSKLNKMSLSPSHSTHQSVASRLFRRSNAPSIQVPSSAQNTTQSRPPIARDNSSTKHARLPRPLSLYGTSPVEGQPSNPNITLSPPRHRHRHREPQPDPEDIHPYELSSILPEGMLTDLERSSSSRYGRQR
jgi:hypothetical protein